MKTIAQQLNVKDFPFIIKDKNGKRTYSEDSTGYWSKREYDKNGKQTYYEDSNRYWCKREFDKIGNQTYFEDSTYWSKRESDSNGCEIYLEDSTSGVITDDRPKVTFTIKEIAEKLGIDVKTLQIKK